MREYSILLSNIQQCSSSAQGVFWSYEVLSKCSVQPYFTTRTEQSLATWCHAKSSLEPLKDKEKSCYATGGDYLYLSQVQVQVGLVDILESE